MRRILVLLAPLLLSFTLLAQQPPPMTAEIAKLVEQLGSEDFAEREDAAKRLEALGPVAIEELRAGLKSENPETVRRAQELFRKAERRLASDKATAPTLVELDVKDKPLDAILAELSKQAKCEVVLGGVKPEDAAFKKLTVSTNGKTPFWNAVLKLCDAADLQVASAGGFLAPGAMPYLGRAAAGVRVSKDPNRTVVLEARGESKRRPASVHGAVLVEAIPFSKNAHLDQPMALLQAWPEPRLQWEGIPGLRVAKATDAQGTRLVAEASATGPRDVVRTTRDGMVLVRNADGTASFVRDTGNAFQLPGGFRPNVRQAVVRFKAAEKPADEAANLELVLFATVRGPIEPLSRVMGLAPNQVGTGVGNADVELSVTCGRGDNDRPIAKVQLTYDPRAIHPATLSDELPDVKGAGAGFDNHTVYGIRITDAEGKPYTLGLTSGANQFDATGKRFVMKMTLELHAEKQGQGPPSAITFWGNHARAVEVPVQLKNVPLLVGK